MSNVTGWDSLLYAISRIGSYPTAVMILTESFLLLTERLMSNSIVRMLGNRKITYILVLNCVEAHGGLLDYLAIAYNIRSILPTSYVTLNCSCHLRIFAIHTGFGDLSRCNAIITSVTFNLLEWKSRPAVGSSVTNPTCGRVPLFARIHRDNTRKMRISGYT